MDRSRCSALLLPFVDPRGAARHRIHHRRTGRPAARSPDSVRDRCVASVADRVMALVRRVQHRSALARELSRAADRHRRCKARSAARSRLHVQPRDLAALAIVTDCRSDWNVATVNLEPVYAPVERLRRAVHASSGKGCAPSAAPNTITLVCHSMGGLRRTRLSAGERSRGGRARRHDRHSAPRNHLRPLCARRQYAADATGVRVRALAWPESDEPVEFICFASQHDNLIVPRDSQVLAVRRSGLVRENRSPGDDGQRSSSEQADRSGRAANESEPRLPPDCSHRSPTRTSTSHHCARNGRSLEVDSPHQVRVSDLVSGRLASSRLPSHPSTRPSRGTS